MTRILLLRYAEIGLDVLFQFLHLLLNLLVDPQLILQQLLVDPQVLLEVVVLLPLITDFDLHAFEFELELLVFDKQGLEAIGIVIEGVAKAIYIQAVLTDFCG